jgi:cell division protein FtsB
VDEGIVRRPVGPPPLGLRVAAVLAVPLLLYALVATGQKALDNYRLNQEAQALRVEIQTLRSENIELQADIQDARTDPAIEALARQQLGLVRPGDNAVVLLADPATSRPGGDSAASGSGAAGTTRQAPIWRQWWEYFFG